MKHAGFRSKLKDLRSLGIRLGASTFYHSGGVNLFRNVSQWRRGDLRQSKKEVHPFGVFLYHRVNPDEDPFFQEARNGAPYTPHDWTGDVCSNCGQKLQTNHPPLLTCYPCAIEGLAVVGPGDAAVDERTVETVAQFEARRG